MAKVFDAPFLSDKIILKAVLFAVLVLGAVVILRQVHQASAAANSGSVITIPAGPASTAPDLSSESSAPAEDSLNSANMGQASNTSQASLSVNGQNIPLPQNGTVSKTIQNQNGTTTTVNASASSTKTSSGSATSTNRSSVNVHVSSNSSKDSL